MAADADYFDHLNQDLLERLPPASRRVLDIGCGSGALARAYRLRNPGADYTGVELDPGAAKRALAHCSRVAQADVEGAACLEALERLGRAAPWDLLVFGDVLEHLRDPLRVLAMLRQWASPGAACVACIPNVGHVSLVHQLLRARWDYQDDGLLDRTHLRFFTQPTMLALFRQAGWTVHECTARVLEPEATDRAIAPLLTLAPALGLDPQAMHLHLSAYQWIVRASNPG